MAARRWQRDQQIRSHASHQRDDVQVRARMSIDKRGEFSRLSKSALEAQSLEDHKLKAEQLKAMEDLENSRRQQEYYMAEEAEKIEKEKMKEFKMRLQIREQSIELRELRAHLQAAYITKELMAQKAEREAARLREKVEEVRAHKQQQDIWASYDKEEKESDEQKIIRQQEHYVELQKQIEEREELKQKSIELILIEKRILDQLVMEYQAELERENFEKMIKVDALKEDIEAFRLEQEAWKEIQKIKFQAEERRITKYLEEQEILQKQRALAAQKKASEKHQVVEKLAEKLVVEHELKMERERLLHELAAEEERQRAERAARLEFQRRVKQRLKMREIWLKEAQEKLQRLEQEKKKDALFRQEMLERLADQEKLEQLSAIRRRAKQAEHRRSVEKLLEERQMEREEARRRVQQMQLEEEQEHKQKLAIIEEERLKMLQEHAANILGYLPRGLLKEDDLAIIAGAQNSS